MASEVVAADSGKSSFDASEYGVASKQKVAREWDKLKNWTCIPDGHPIGDAFKQWAINNVPITNKPDPGILLGANEGKLNVDPSLYEREPKLPERSPADGVFANLEGGPTSRADLRNQVTFEMAKALWYQKNDGDTSTPRTPFGKAFENVWNKHAAIRESQFARWNGENLSRLADLDWQSHFSYAVRATVGKLDAPKNVSQKDWNNGKKAVEELLAPVLSGHR